MRIPLVKVNSLYQLGSWVSGEPRNPRIQERKNKELKPRNTEHTKQLPYDSMRKATILSFLSHLFSFLTELPILV